MAETDFLFRRMQPEDAKDVFSIEENSFSRPWSYDDLAKVTEDEKAFYEVAVDRTSGQVVGYIGAYLILDEADINQVAVSPLYRRRGIAQALLQDFMQKLRKKNIDAITLEVRASNEAAIALYEKCGFKNEGVRKNFYEAPVEDAYIMWKR